jgi:hypothetical protein
MSVEIANNLHAMGSLFLGNPPTLVRTQGFTDLVRTGPGVFEVGLVEPLDFLGGVVQIVPGADTARMVSARIRSLASFPVRNILITCFDAAGVAADIGEVNATVHRYPSSGEPPP